MGGIDRLAGDIVRRRIGRLHRIIQNRTTSTTMRIQFAFTTLAVCLALLAGSVVGVSVRSGLLVFSRFKFRFSNPGNAAAVARPTHDVSRARNARARRGGGVHPQQRRHCPRKVNCADCCCDDCPPNESRRTANQFCRILRMR